MTDPATTAATITGWVLFGLSEFLPLINIPTNGIIQTFVLGIGKAFKAPSPGGELAKSLIDTNVSYTNMVNQASMNPGVRQAIETLLNDPVMFQLFQSINGNPELINKVASLVYSSVTVPMFGAPNHDRDPVFEQLNNSPEKERILRAVHFMLDHPESEIAEEMKSLATQI